MSKYKYNDKADAVLAALYALKAASTVEQKIAVMTLEMGECNVSGMGWSGMSDVEKAEAKLGAMECEWLEAQGLIRLILL